MFEEVSEVGRRKERVIFFSDPGKNFLGYISKVSF